VILFLYIFHSILFIITNILVILPESIETFTNKMQEDKNLYL